MKFFIHFLLLGALSVSATSLQYRVRRSGVKGGVAIGHVVRPVEANEYEASATLGAGRARLQARPQPRPQVRPVVSRKQYNEPQYSNQQTSGEEDDGSYRPGPGEADSEPIPDSIGGKVGKAGVDYPAYREIPETSFDCSQTPYNYGMYADEETQCQVYHVCLDGRKESFLCGIGTVFNQAILTCDYWHAVECGKTKEFYSKNEELGKASPEPGNDQAAVAGGVRQQVKPQEQYVPQVEYARQQQKAQYKQEQSYAQQGQYQTQSKKQYVQPQQQYGQQEYVQPQPQKQYVQPQAKKQYVQPQKQYIQEEEQQYVQPQKTYVQPQKQYVQPQAQKTYVQPQKQYVQPQAQKSYVQPQPQKQYVQPQPQKTYVQPQAQKTYVQPQPQKQYVQAQKQYKPQAAKYEEPQQEEYYEQPQEQYVAPKPQKTYVQPQAQKTYVQPKPQKTYVQPQAQKQYVQPQAQKTYVQPQPQKTYVQPQPQKQYVQKQQYKPQAANYEEAQQEDVYEEPQQQYVAPKPQKTYVQPQAQKQYVQPQPQKTYVQPQAQYTKQAKQYTQKSNYVKEEAYTQNQPTQLISEPVIQPVTAHQTCSQVDEDGSCVLQVESASVNLNENAECGENDQSENCVTLFRRKQGLKPTGNKNNQNKQKNKPAFVQKPKKVEQFDNQGCAQVDESGNCVEENTYAVAGAQAQAQSGNYNQQPQPRPKKLGKFRPATPQYAQNAPSHRSKALAQSQSQQAQFDETTQQKLQAFA